MVHIKSIRFLILVMFIGNIKSYIRLMKMHINILIINVILFAKKADNDIPTLDNYTHSDIDMVLMIV